MCGTGRSPAMRDAPDDKVHLCLATCITSMQSGYLGAEYSRADCPMPGAKVRPARRPGHVPRTDPRERDGIDRHATVDVHRLERALGREPASSRDRLRRLVAGEDLEVEPDDVGRGHGPVDDEGQGPGRHAAPTRRSRDPVAERRAMIAPLRARSVARDGADDLIGRLSDDREMGGGPVLPAGDGRVDQRLRIRFVIRPRDRHPARDLGILACSEDGSRIVLAPSPQPDDAVGQDRGRRRAAVDWSHPRADPASQSTIVRDCSRRNWAT